MMKAQVTLTPTESKRLIAHAVSQMDAVKNALKEGTILIALSTTNAFVLEEISGRSFEKERYCSGIITKKGTYANSPPYISKEAAVIKGKLTYVDNSEEIIKNMKKTDVFIKSANALDPCRHAGVFVADRDSGELGHVIGHVYARKIHFLIPTGLEKLIFDVRAAAKVAGQREYAHSMKLPVSVFPIEGTIITEIEALDILFNLHATLIGAGGIGGAEGSVTLVVEGEEADVKEAVEYMRSIKGEQLLCPPVHKKEAKP
jgi:hypothetical protein